MIALSSPITTSPIFDQLALVNVTIVPNGNLIASALPSNGEVLLKGPISHVHKSVSAIQGIADAIIAQAVEQTHYDAPVIKRVILSSDGVNTPITIRVWSEDQSGNVNPLWVCRDAGEIINNNAAFAQVFSDAMTAIGALFTNQ